MTYNVYDFRKKSKYGNVKVMLGGEKFDSKWEADCWAALLLRQHARELTGLERQVRVPLKAVTGETVCHIILDFRWFLPDGTACWADAKGWITPEWKLKQKWFEAQEGVKIQIMKRGKRA